MAHQPQDLVIRSFDRGDEDAAESFLVAVLDGEVGRALMSEAERMLREAGCPKINLQVRGTNDSAVGFYEALGYTTDDVVSLGRRLEHDAT